MDFIELGPVPCDEPCAQVGDDNFEKDNKSECMRFLRGLVRKHPECKFKIKQFKHDFGPYSEVVVCYDSSDAASIDAAYAIQNNTPTTWAELER
jgi:hypothetical protein